MKSQLCEKFKSCTIEDIIGESREILYLNDSETLKSAIEHLSKKDVRSAPIKDHTEITFLDYECFLEYFIDDLRKVDSHLKIGNHKHHVEELLRTKISSVTAKASSKYTTVKSGTSAFEVGQILASGKSRVLIEKDGKITNIVTHSDFVHYITAHIKDFDTLTKPINELELIKEPPKTIDDSFRAIDAFALMRDVGRSFLPITDFETQELVSVLSVRDLKILWKVDPSILEKPVMDYITIVRQASLDDKFPYFAIKADERFDNVLKKLKAVRVNRLLVIDEKKHVTGAVSVAGIVTSIFN